MMQKQLICTLILAGSSAWAELPSHCTESETAIVDAWVGKTSATESGYKHSPNSKLVSLCADQAKEPFTRVSYRYGRPNQIEMALDATPSAPFTIANLSTGPRTGMDVIAFNRGEFSYYLAINGGQASGVQLQVFKGKQRIVDHFSGNHAGDDYQLGAVEIDFSGNQARSPVLKMGKLKHDIAP